MAGEDRRVRPSKLTDRKRFLILMHFLGAEGDIHAAFATLKAQEPDCKCVNFETVEAFLKTSPHARKILDLYADQKIQVGAFNNLQRASAFGIQQITENLFSKMSAILDRVHQYAAAHESTTIAETKKILTIVDKYVDSIVRLSMVVQRYKDGLHPRSGPVVDLSKRTGIEAKTVELPGLPSTIGQFKIMPVAEYVKLVGRLEELEPPAAVSEELVSGNGAIPPKVGGGTAS